jgi:hypothetical protein
MSAMVKEPQSAALALMEKAESSITGSTEGIIFI